MAKTRLPAFMLRHAAFAGRDPGAVEMPQLKLLQASSRDLDAFENTAEGEFWHSLANERLGSTLRICPVYIDSRFILWRPHAAGGGILARADDGKHWTPADTEFTVELDSGRKVTWRTARTVKASGLDKRGSSDPSDPRSPPAATRLYSIVCAFLDRQDLPPAVLLLQRAAGKAAIKLIGKLRTLQAPSFGVVVEVTAIKERSKSREPYGCAFEIAGPIESRVLYEDYFAQYRFFIEHGLKVQDVESAQEPHPDPG